MEDPKSKKRIHQAHLESVTQKRKLNESDSDTKTEEEAEGLEYLFGGLEGLEQTPTNFFETSWEKSVFSVSRGNENYYSNLFSQRHLSDLVGTKEIFGDSHMKAFFYKDGVKQFHPVTGRVTVETLKEIRDKHVSVQFFQPQQFCTRLESLLRTLEKQLGCLVGCNAYLTPPHSQGLAPHYDNVDVFILQVEGEKHWALYELPEPEKLPEGYSEDLSQIEIGKPKMKITLKCGDLMYFPRGTIHQAFTTDQYSTHLTISTYHDFSWFHFLQKAMPLALQAAREEDISFRRHLPLNFFSYMGMAHQSESKTESSYSSASSSTGTTAESSEVQQDAFSSTASHLFQKLEPYLKKQLHSAADDFSLDFICNRLPPDGYDRQSIEYECDICAKVPIQGVVLHCKVCPEFDICSECYNDSKQREQHDTKHEFMTLVVQNPAPVSQGLVKLAVHPQYLRLTTVLSTQFDFGNDSDTDMSDAESDGEQEQDRSTPAGIDGQDTNSKANNEKQDSEKGGEQDGEKDDKKDDQKDGEQDESGEADMQDESEAVVEQKNEMSVEESKIVELFHSLNNQPENHMNSHTAPEPPTVLRFPEHFKPAIIYLIKNYKTFVPVKSIPIEQSDALELCHALWAERLLMTSMF